MIQKSTTVETINARIETDKMMTDYAGVWRTNMKGVLQRGGQKENLQPFILCLVANHLCNFKCLFSCLPLRLFVRLSVCMSETICGKFVKITKLEYRSLKADPVKKSIKNIHDKTLKIKSSFRQDCLFSVINWQFLHCKNKS